MSLLEPLAPFTDNVGQIISAADLATLRSNVALVDSLTYRRMPAFDSSATEFTTTPGFVPPSTDGYASWRIWKGGIRWQTGVTTIFFAGTATRSTLGGSNETLLCYANGVLILTITPSGGAFAVNTGFTGYTDGQVVTIEVRLGGTTWGSNGIYVFHAIYCGPIDYTVTAWPGVPTFSSVYTASQLNQIVSAYTWLYNRMAAVPMVGGLAQVYQLGPFNLAGNTTANGAPIYTGAVLRGYTEDTLTIFFQVVNATTPGLRYKVLLNGSLVATGPTWGPGTQTATEVISLTSVTVGTRAQVAIYTEVVSEAARALWTFNYWTISAVRSQPNYGSGLSYPSATLTSTPLGDVSISPSTLNTFLNSLTSALNSAKTRVDANTSVWARSYAMSQRFSRRDNFVNIADEEHRSRPRLVRLSDRLLVSGKNVSVGYGPISIETTDRGPQYQSYRHSHEETAIDGDKLETKIVYLDSMQGLYPGTGYFLTGSVIYAAELL